MRPLFLAPLGDLSQLTFDRPRPWKRASVHFFETPVRCVEGESARYAHGDPDGAAIKFDRKTLSVHNSLLASSDTAHGLGGDGHVLG